MLHLFYFDIRTDLIRPRPNGSSSFTQDRFPTRQAPVPTKLREPTSLH